MSKNKMPKIDLTAPKSAGPQAVIGRVMAFSNTDKLETVQPSPSAERRVVSDHTDRNAMRRLIDEAGDDIQDVLDRLEDR